MTPNERLFLLAEALVYNANNPKGMKFDLKKWLESKKPAMDCGTTGCAIGLALLIPAFNAEGFVHNPTMHGVPQQRPEFKNFNNWDAVKKFFDLTYTQSKDLFYSYNAEERGDPIQGAKAELRVAQRIREFACARLAASVTS